MINNVSTTTKNSADHHVSLPWAIMKFEIQAAEEVTAVALARVAELNISTGYAQLRGPDTRSKVRAL